MALQLQAGMFIQAWVEAQPCMPTLKQPSVALFYVTGVGKLIREGMDVEVRPISARTGGLMTAMEKGPFALEGGGTSPAALHLCAEDTCVMADEGRLLPYTRLHIFAYQVFTRDQLSKSW